MKDSLLWELYKEGHGSTYILGTMHVKSESVFRRVEQIKELIALVDLFAAEYDLDALRGNQQGGDFLLGEGVSMSMLLGERKFLKIRNSIKKSFNVDIKPFDQFMPLLLMNLIGESVLSQEYSLPLDVYLWEFAKDQEKVLVGVESYESQIAIMKKIRVKDQLKMIKDLSRNTGKFRRNIHKMADLYMKEDIGTLYKYGKKTLGRYKDTLLTRRNHIMAGRVEELSKDFSVFCAIGAGHLAGKSGVLRILKNKGWKLKAL